jgi:hypothetical protein
MHVAIIPDPRRVAEHKLSVDRAGLVTLYAQDDSDSVSLMMFTTDAAKLRDALNALDLDN